MNGRVYDYNVGRFMSVDPVIQSPENSQSVNPYSYIMNNPLGGTDPSGYTSKADTTTETKTIRVKETGSRVRRAVGTRTKTTTKNSSGEITNVSTEVKLNNGKITVSSVNYSNGKADNADVAIVDSKTGDTSTTHFDNLSQSQVTATKTGGSGNASIGAVKDFPETGSNSWRLDNDAYFVLATDMYNHEYGLDPGVGDNGFWMPQRLKAQAMRESGSSATKSEFLRDPLQVNRTYYDSNGNEIDTDWTNSKLIHTELTGKQQVMNPFTSSRNALMWLRYKGWLHDARGRKYRYEGDAKALFDYNGNTKLDRTLNGKVVPHNQWYSETILNMERGMY